MFYRVLAGFYAFLLFGCVPVLRGVRPFKPCADSVHAQGALRGLQTVLAKNRCKQGRWVGLFAPKFRKPRK